MAELRPVYGIRSTVRIIVHYAPVKNDPYNVLQRVSFLAYAAKKPGPSIEAAAGVFHGTCQ